MKSKIYCPNCGAEYSAEGDFCPNCSHPNILKNKSLKINLVAFLLCLFLGGLAVHRFYVGKIGTGILQLFLCLILIGYVWVFIDLILIILGAFSDKDGKKLSW